MMHKKIKANKQKPFYCLMQIWNGEEMEAPREHIKRYYSFAYRRAIGASILTVAIAVAIGVLLSTIFPVVSSSMFSAVIGILAALTVLVIVLNFANAHFTAVQYMNSKEKKLHRRRGIVWFSLLVIGLLAFFAPLMVLTGSTEAIALLFMVGGILWVLYLATAFVFENYYNELAFGATITWLLFAVILLSGNSALARSNVSYAFNIGIIMTVAVFGIIGSMMLFAASREFVIEFKKIAERENSKEATSGNVAQKRAARGRAAANRKR